MEEVILLIQSKRIYFKFQHEIIEKHLNSIKGLIIMIRPMQVK